jgi:hypothetical protein
MDSKMSRGEVVSSPRWWDDKDLELHIDESIQIGDFKMTYYLSGRGRRQCWSCPRIGTLQRVHVPSGLKDFVGDDKNHLICSQCVKLLEQARQAHSLTIHPNFQAKMDALLPLED